MSLVTIRICNGCNVPVGNFGCYFNSPINEHGDVDLCDECFEKLAPLLECLKAIGQNFNFELRDNTKERNECQLTSS